MTNVEAYIFDLLYERAGRKTALRPETEIYKRLRISGIDLYELIEAIQVNFSTDFSDMKLSDYAPEEGEYDFPWPFRGRGYRSLTVGMLVRAAESGRWAEGD